MNRSDNYRRLPEFIHKMEQAALDPLVIDTFAHFYRKVVSGETGLIREGDIDPIEREDIEDSKNLAPYADAGQNALNHTAMIVLNGGLGTSMGLTRAKSLLIAKNGKTFLEVITEQARHSEVLEISRYRVVGNLDDPGLTRKWIKGENIQVTYDYFRKD